MKPIKLLFSIIAFATTLSACSSDKDEPNPTPDPETPAITVPYYLSGVNMMNETNGKSFLGNTDVYISYDGQFVSGGKYLIGVPVNNEYIFDPEINYIGGLILSRQTPVIPGTVYHFYPSAGVIEFHSGAKAILNGSLYANVYVDSWINSGKRGALIYFESLRAKWNRNSIAATHQLQSSAVSGETRTLHLGGEGSSPMEEVDVKSVTIDYGDINIKSVNGDVTITAKGPSKGVVELYERAGLLCRVITINIVP